MDKASLISYQKKWQLVDQEQKVEQSQMTMEEKYQKIVVIYRLAISLDQAPKRDEESERMVWDTWSDENRK